MSESLELYVLLCQFFRDQTESFLSWFYSIFPPVVAGAGMSTSSMIKRIMFKVTSYTFKLPVTLSKFSSKTSHGNYQWHICKISPLTNITCLSEFCKKNTSETIIFNPLKITRVKRILSVRVFKFLEKPLEKIRKCVRVNFTMRKLKF